MIIYPTWTQHLNNRPYSVIHAEYYVPTIPEAYTEGIEDENSSDWLPDYPQQIDPFTQSVGFDVSHHRIPVEPMYQPTTPDHTVSARVPISYIIDMWEKDVACGIVSPLDIVEIFHVCDAYLVENFQLAQQNVKVLEDCHRVLAFRNAFYKRCFVRVVLAYEDWKDKYQSSSAEQMEMFKILAMFDASAANKLDAVKSLAHSPVQLPEIPKEARTSILMNAQNGFQTEHAGDMAPPEPTHFSTGSLFNTYQQPAIPTNGVANEGDFYG